MESEQQFNLIHEGKDSWNGWRRRNPFVRPDFHGKVLRKFDFSGFDLQDADFRRAEIEGCTFDDCDLSGANFSNALLQRARFKGAALQNSDFSGADLSNASFYKAVLIAANLSGANLFKTAFREAQIGGTIFGDVDLETAIGLEEIEHTGTSSVSTDTLLRSGGNIPKLFLAGAGLPDILIDYVPSLVEANSGIRFHSCFISYSHDDEAFARHLWARMRQERIRVWFAPEEMQGGQKLFEQIERAIVMHDKLLLVLSKRSMRSNWVETEMRKALQQERVDGRRKLFPIRLVEMGAIQEWRCMDADSGRDLARDLREYFIPDFSNWIIEKNFEKGFMRLRSDLRDEGVAMARSPIAGNRRLWQ